VGSSRKMLQSTGQPIKSGLGFVFKIKEADQLARVTGVIIHGGEHRNILLHRQPIEGVEVLGENTYPTLDLQRILGICYAKPENLGLPRSGRTKALKDLEGRRLPGTIGPQKGKDLTPTYGEGDVVNSR